MIESFRFLWQVFSGRDLFLSMTRCRNQGRCQQDCRLGPPMVICFMKSSEFLLKQKNCGKHQLQRWISRKVRQMSSHIPIIGHCRIPCLFTKIAMAKIEISKIPKLGIRKCRIFFRFAHPDILMTSVFGQHHFLKDLAPRNSKWRLSSHQNIQPTEQIPSKYSKKKSNLIPNIGLNPYANSVATGHDHDTAWMDILSLGKVVLKFYMFFPHSFQGAFGFPDK